MLRIEAATRLPRIEMIARVSQAIQGAGAGILDSRFYSNLTVFINGEVTSARLAFLRDALIATGLNISDRSLALLDQHSTQPAIPFHLVVTFIHSDPDLRIPVPAISGLNASAAYGNQFLTHMDPGF